MLPFLRADKMQSVIMAKHKPEGDSVPEHEEGEMHPGLMIAAEDLIRAVHSKDAKAVAMAMEDAFEVCDTYSQEPEEVQGEV